MATANIQFKYLGLTGFFLLISLLFLADRDSSNSVVHACCRCSKLLAKREYAQCVLVQFLIEGAIAKVNLSSGFLTCSALADSNKLMNLLLNPFRVLLFTLFCFFK